jgi:hypothetical protein
VEKVTEKEATTIPIPAQKLVHVSRISCLTVESGQENNLAVKRVNPSEET